jgi:4-diphosphocytidyl-2-C-methyl-D-erythritol kinase
MSDLLVEQAPAKVNLTLRVGARRDDGFHALESLVAFADVADRLTLATGRPLGLEVEAADRDACGALSNNLVLRAAHALADCVNDLQLGHFVLTKQIPVAAGLGGGSADAAAALRLLARANDIALDDLRLAETAASVGADVPVCLDPHAGVMRGTGEILSAPVVLPKLAAVLVNPGVPLATGDVFAEFDRRSEVGTRRAPKDDGEPSAFEARLRRAVQDNDGELLTILQSEANDLETAATVLLPVIADVLAALSALPQCRLARMSGSGATCFALCDSAVAAEAAARTLQASHPYWWIRATGLS